MKKLLGFGKEDTVSILKSFKSHTLLVAIELNTQYLQFVYFLIYGVCR